MIDAQAVSETKTAQANARSMLNTTIRHIVVLFLLLPVPASGAHAQSFDAKALSRKPEAPAPKPKDRAGGMKACPEYGAGFYRLAGSDTCIRIGGGVSTDVGTSGVLR